MRRTVQEKYGEEYINTSQVPHIKKKIVDTYTKNHGGMGMASESAAKKTLETTLERYGKEGEEVTNVFQLDAIKDKIRQTHEENWGGIGFASEKLSKRSQDTFKEKYGDELFSGSGGYRDTLIKKAFMEKYGVETVSKIPGVKEKIVSTYIENNGGMGNARDSVKEELDENKKEFKRLHDLNKYSNIEIAKIMNVSLGRVVAWGKSFGIEMSNPNRLNELWKIFIEKETGIVFNYEGLIYGDKRRVDLYNEESKIGIEINPTITHATQASPFHGVKVAVEYHQQKAISAEKNGWHLIQVFDWDNPENIVRLIKSLFNIEQTVIYADNCESKEISMEEAQRFIDFNYKENDLETGDIAYGLFHKKNIVQVVTFKSKCISKKREIESYELMEMYSRRQYKIIDGVNKLFETFINSKHTPKKIKAFVDYAKDQGKTYEEIGMTFVGLTNSNEYYAHIGNGETYRIEEVSKKFKKEYHNLGQTEQEFMNDKKFYKINDAGNKIFEWKRN